MSDDDNSLEEVHDLWPSLHEAHGMTAARKNSKEEEEGWDLCSDDGVENVVVVQLHPNVMKHSASSPALDKSYTIVEEENVVDTKKGPVIVGGSSSDDSSHVMVPGPPSVLSETTTTPPSARRVVPSFRDAILLHRKALQAKEKRAASVSPTVVRKIARPKLVVVAPPSLRRSFRSTGDLQTFENDEEIQGETDAMEYYHRKAMGYAGRRNGLRTRPDEAKRKAIILTKKRLQQEQQQQQQQAAC